MIRADVVLEEHLGSPAVDGLVDVFLAHLERANGGLSFSVYRDGQPLINLHGGSYLHYPATRESVATPARAPGPGVQRRVWGPDSLAVLFSGTKGLVATVTAMAVARGLLDVHAPVARYWPEFAGNGKADVSVAQLLDHTVGLLYTDPEPASGQLDSAANAAQLARQRPAWEPGTRVAYHAVTFGYLVDAVLVRATGRRAGTLMRQWLAEPYGLDLHLGLPAALEPRVAPVFRAPGYRISTFLEDPARRRVVERMYGSALLGEQLPANTREFHESALASGAGVGTAEAIARCYSLLAAERLVDAETLELFTTRHSSGLDAVNDRPVVFGLGYELQDPLGSYGPVDRAYGHSGAGGCLHGVWPEYGIGFSFHTNEMLSEDVDTRARDLLAALHAALER